MISLKVENAENTAALSKILIDRLDAKNKSFAIELCNLRSSEKQQSETIKTLQLQVNKLELEKQKLMIKLTNKTL